MMSAAGTRLRSQDMEMPLMEETCVNATLSLGPIKTVGEAM